MPRGDQEPCYPTLDFRTMLRAVTPLAPQVGNLVPPSVDRLMPGDVLFVSFTHDICDEEMERVLKEIREYLPENKIICVPLGTTFNIVHAFPPRRAVNPSAVVDMNDPPQPLSQESIERLRKEFESETR